MNTLVSRRHFRHEHDRSGRSWEAARKAVTALAALVAFLATFLATALLVAQMHP